jgi:tetratricopeptide (TPR) repeat protein
MAIVAEAFGGWLAGQLAEAGRKRLATWLLGSEQQRALQQAATAAIHATARVLRPGPVTADDVQGADHLARVVDQIFKQPPTPEESLTGQPTLLQGLQAGVAVRLVVLGDANITGTGQSSAELLEVTVPALAEVLTSHLVREIVTRGASGGPLTPLADQLNQDLTHLQGQQHSAGLTRLMEDMQAVLAMLHRLDHQAQSLPASTALPLGRPIHELTDPFTLEVHRAIDTPGVTAQLPKLPIYIERDHDRRLQAVIEQAAEGYSAAAVLVGGSSTGKTRACWEAIQGLPDDWRLWHPIDPSRPEAAAIALPRAGPRTVIWLNEAQHYLLTPAGDLGERVAAGLRELLRDTERSPVLLLGTIWPEYWAILTTPPSAEQADDPHAQARALLTGVDISVPDAFHGPALQTLHGAAQADPRLAEAAARAEGGRITQFLAGVPALLERYRNAPADARALIEAAMDARRLGHSLLLSQSLLEAAAPGYLTDQQWDGLGEDWLEQALAYCAAPCRGARGPLTRPRPRPGQQAAAQPRYRLADYLEQTGRARRRTVLAPAALWDALVEHANERDVLAIAEEAEGRGLYHHAYRFYRRAAEAGDRDSLGRAAALLGRAGRIDEAIVLYRRAAEAGDPDGLGRAAGLLEKAGRLDEAIVLYRRAAEAGDPDGLGRAAGLLEKAGRLDEAIVLYRRAIEAGDLYPLGRVAELLEEAGRLDEAINWLQTRATEADDPSVSWWAARLLEKAGRIDDAIDWYQRTAEASNTDTLGQAARLLATAGRVDEAIGLYQRAGGTGDPSALRRAGELLERADRVDEAIGMYQRAAEAGDHDALERAAVLMEGAGQLDEAIDWLQTCAAEVGNTLGLRRAAGLLERAERIDEAIAIYQRAAGASDALALQRMVELLEDAGRLDEAVAVYERAAKAGDLHAPHREAQLLERAGRIDEAIAVYRRAAKAGDPNALGREAELLDRTGRIDEAIHLYQRASEARNSYALGWAAELLEEAGRLDEAIDWLQTRAPEAGDHDALGRAAGLMGRAGRVDEAIGLYQRAAEAGDPDALRRVIGLLEGAGRLDEAIGLHERAAEAGDPDALRRAGWLLEVAGRFQEAIGLYERAAETGDPYALGKAARLLEATGHLSKAIRWSQRAAETGDPDALSWTARLLEQADQVDEARRLRQYGLEPGSHIADEWQ